MAHPPSYDGKGSALTESHPRVLLITPGALNRYRESGVTLTNLLTGWPQDRITQIHADPAPPREVLQSPRFFDAAGGARSSYAPTVRRVRAARQFAMGRSNTGLLWARMSTSLRGWLRANPPDIIVSQTGNLAFLRLTRRVADETGAPVVLYAADDWVQDWPANNLGRRIPPLTDILARTVRREFTALAQRSVAHMAISDAMGRAYAQRYGGEWLTVPNPVDLGAWPERVPEDVAFTSNRPFRILYSGSLHPVSQLPGVIDVSTAVSSLHQAGVPVTFEVATHGGFQYLRDTIERPGVSLVDLVPPDDLPARLAGVDLLVLPLVFDPLRLRYIGLSMPGKVAEYLASGTPVLAYGPRGSAVIDHAADHGWAEIVSVRSVAALGSRIGALMQDGAARRALAVSARQVAAEQFSLARVVPVFQETLRRAASRHPDRATLQP